MDQFGARSSEFGDRQKCKGCEMYIRTSEAIVRAEQCERTSNVPR